MVNCSDPPWGGGGLDTNCYSHFIFILQRLLDSAKAKTLVLTPPTGQTSHSTETAGAEDGGGGGGQQVHVPSILKLMSSSHDLSGAAREEQLTSRCVSETFHVGREAAVSQ